MICVFVNWLKCRKRSLDKARQDSQQARQSVVDKLAQARKAGTPVCLSRAAMERIAEIDDCA